MGGSMQGIIQNFEEENIYPKKITEIEAIKNQLTIKTWKEYKAFDTLPGKNDKEKMVWICLKFGLDITRIASIIKISERSIYRILEKCF